MSQKERLKITLPLMVNDKPHRGCGPGSPDRPGVRKVSHNIREVPAVLLPYIPLVDWVKFCNGFVEANKSEEKINNAGMVITLGFFIFIPCVILLSIGGSGQAVLLSIFVVFSLALIVAGCIRMSNETQQHNSHRDGACEELSKSLNHGVCVYFKHVSRLHKETEDSDQYREYYYLEVWVNPTGWGYQRGSPFLVPHSTVPKSTVMIEDDWVEVLGETAGRQTEWAFYATAAATTTTTHPAVAPQNNNGEEEAAVAANHETDATTPTAPIEVPYGSADTADTGNQVAPQNNNGEEEAAVAANHETDATTPTAPTEVPYGSADTADTGSQVADVASSKAAPIESLDGVKGELTDKEQSEATPAKTNIPNQGDVETAAAAASNHEEEPPVSKTKTKNKKEKKNKKHKKEKKDKTHKKKKKDKTSTKAKDATAATETVLSDNDQS